MKERLKSLVCISLCFTLLFSVIGCNVKESKEPLVSTPESTTSEDDNTSSDSTTDTSQDDSNVTSNTETTAQGTDETSVPSTTAPSTTKPTTTKPSTTTKVNYATIAKKYNGRWYLDGYADVYLDITTSNKSMYINATNYTFPFDGNSDCAIVPAYTIYPHKYPQQNNGSVWSSACDISFDSWEKRLSKYKIKLSENSISINEHIFVKTKGTIAEGAPISNTINFKDVEGVWYAEGYDDVTITFSIYDNWVWVDGQNFNHTNGTIKLHGGTGGTEYYYDNGFFTSDSITLVNSGILVYRKGDNVVTFYRQENYPQEILWPHEKLLQAIDGYYWYLDGYDYTYLHPTIIPRNDHGFLDWESQNIYIEGDSLVAFEDFAYAEYRKYDVDLSAWSTTHNSLGTSTKYADSLISDFDMHVLSNKLYMTVGDTTYSFTRYKSKKDVKVGLTAKSDSVTVEIGETFGVNITVSPFWNNHTISATSTNSSVARVISSNVTSEDGNVTLYFHAFEVGTAKLTFVDTETNVTTSVFVTVKPKPPTLVTGITLDRTELQLTRGETSTLVATVSPANASNKTVIWSSSDNAVAQVSSSGLITAIGKGTATITATSADGSYIATCTITVTDPPITVKAGMGVGYYMSSSGSYRGVYVEANASGGSGNYVEYYIKVYFNGVLVAEGAKNEIIVTVANGTYTAEVYVKDSNGNEATHTTSMTLSGY